MPSRTLTKRVKYRRRQQDISKNAKRKARRVRTHKHNKSVKRMKKVMRGGNIGYGMRHSSIVDDYDYSDSSESTYKPPETPVYTAYVLYDQIPRPKEIVDKTWNGSNIDVPICVIIFHPVDYSLDNIYLFFNNEVKSEDILSMVKVLLGIKQDVKFSLNPPIKTKEGTCGDCFLKRTFVKLERCQSRTELLKQGKFPKLTYCVKSMDFNLWFDKDTTLVEELIRAQYDISENDKIITETKHEIVTSDETYKDLNGKKIREQLEKSLDPRKSFFQESHFTKRVKESNACLPDLYKEFFKPKNLDEPKTEQDYFNRFYKEYYTERENEKGLVSKTDESYDSYISKIKGMIVQDLQKRNQKYMIDSKSYEILEKDRPLRISRPFKRSTRNFTTHDAEIFVEAEFLISTHNSHLLSYFPVPTYYSDRKKWYEEEEKKETDNVKQKIREMQNKRYGPPPPPNDSSTKSPAPDAPPQYTDDAPTQPSTMNASSAQ